MRQEVKDCMERAVCAQCIFRCSDVAYILGVNCEECKADEFSAWKDKQYVPINMPYDKIYIGMKVDWDFRIASSGLESWDTFLVVRLPSSESDTVGLRYLVGGHYGRDNSSFFGTKIWNAERRFLSPARGY